MADPRHILGQAAEDATARGLAACGWRVLGRRQRAVGGGEIDLLALDPEAMLVAVEVRARRSRRLGAPEASIDLRHVARMRSTLASVAARGAVAHRGLRVDIVTAEPEPDVPGRWRLRRTPAVG